MISSRGVLLRGGEERLAAMFASMLDEERPAQVSPVDTLLTAEGPRALIALIPRRSLAGVSIGVWFYNEEPGAQVFWAQVVNLNHDHDDLDLGPTVAAFSKQNEESLILSVVRSVRAQLHRPIEVVVIRTPGRSGRERVEFRFENDKRVFGKTGRRPLFSLRRRQESREVHTITFADARDAPISVPPDVERWFAR